jgi:uncharacterized protein YecE (DUF72 family)
VHADVANPQVLAVPQFERVARRVWAYFNNDRDAHAVKNARQLLRLLSSD